VWGQRQGVAVRALHRVDAVAVKPEPAVSVIGYAASPQPAVVLPGSADHEGGEPGISAVCMVASTRNGSGTCSTSRL